MKTYKRKSHNFYVACWQTGKSGYNTFIYSFRLMIFVKIKIVTLSYDTELQTRGSVVTNASVRTKLLTFYVYLSSIRLLLKLNMILRSRKKTFLK